MGTDETRLEIRRYHRAERLGHALYGLIIVTATLGAERAHVTTALAAFEILLSTAVVLFLAHTYSALMAERAVEGGHLGKIRRRLVIIDNVPLVAAIVVPMILFALVGLGIIDLQLAYRAAIAVSLAALFAVGLYQGRVASMGWYQSIFSGAAAGAIGVIVVLIEAFFD